MPVLSDIPETPPSREVDIFRRVAALIEERLPEAWVSAVDEQVVRDGSQVDGVLRILAPSGEGALVLVEAKRTVEARDVSRIVERLRSFVTFSPGQLLEDNAAREPLATGEGAVAALVAARYLNPRVRERLLELGIGYADATGNLYLCLSRPALFLRDQGSEGDPWRGPGRPRGSLKGPPAARVIRALADYRPPVSVPELIKRANVSTGAGYRVVDFLQQEELIERESRGPIEQVDWRGAIERWSRDYRLGGAGSVMSMLQPRGIAAVLKRLPQVREQNYALTGSVAASYYAEYAPAKLAMIYADDPDVLSAELDLRPVESGANVLLVAPGDDFVFDRSGVIDGVRVAAPSQIAIDLLERGGRAATEAEVLMDWMEANEPEWRR